MTTGCSFTLTVEQRESYLVLRRIFAGYNNVRCSISASINTEFVDCRYDLIFSVPNFGVRSLAEDDNFMSRDQDAVALENLLLHTVSGGELIITMPARITFAQGKTGEFDVLSSNPIESRKYQNCQKAPSKGPASKRISSM